MELGSLFVIDGVDGNGKQTQTKLLQKRLEAENYSVLNISFPRYGKVSAAMVEAYLQGDFGLKPDEVNPYVASSFFAVDRFASLPDLQQALTKGKIVLIDRYVTSNMAYQGSKFTNHKERQDFLKWIYDFEYTKACLPLPKVTIFLNLPIKVSLDLINNRQLKNQQSKKKDIHESDIAYLNRSRETYLEIVDLFPNIEIMECYVDNTFLSPESIHELIWQKIKPLL